MKKRIDKTKIQLKNNNLKKIKIKNVKHEQLLHTIITTNIIEKVKNQQITKIKGKKTK